MARKSYTCKLIAFLKKQRFKWKGITKEVNSCEIIFKE